MKKQCSNCNAEISNFRLFLIGLMFKNTFECNNCKAELHHGIENRKLGITLTVYAFFVSFGATYSFGRNNYFFSIFFLLLTILGILYWYKKSRIILIPKIKNSSN